MRDLILSIIVSFLVCMAVGPIVIPILQKLKMGQQVRDDGPQTHLVKAGTPTMGGVIIVVGLAAGTLLFMDAGGYMAVPALIMTVGFGLIGFLDDFIKSVKKRSMGLKAYQKVIGQLGLSILIAVFAYTSSDIGSVIVVPFTNIEWDMGFWYIPFMVFIIIAIVNSVNLTDGLDGLASGVTLIVSAGFGIIFYYMAQSVIVNAGSPYVFGLSNMMVFSGALAGACLGFLRFNSHPAKVFMGDTGSMALGGAVSMMTVCSRLVLFVPILCGVFFATAVSVILQVGSYKLRGKRIFKMAPLHHHFELKGMPETRVVSMYMIVSTILCLVTLLMLA